MTAARLADEILTKPEAEREFLTASLRTYAAEARRLVARPDRSAATLAEVAKLFAHFPASKAAAAAEDAVADDWAEDLAPYPVDLVRMACSVWRTAGHEWRPNPGQLLQLIKPAMLMRLRLLKRAEEALAEIAKPGTLRRPQAAE